MRNFSKENTDTEKCWYWLCTNATMSSFYIIILHKENFVILILLVVQDQHPINSIKTSAGENSKIFPQWYLARSINEIALVERKNFPNFLYTRFTTRRQSYPATGEMLNYTSYSAELGNNWAGKMEKKECSAASREANR